jgi:hypothetical protein
LTPEQEAEFTFLNYVVYDTMLSEAKRRDEIIPCWLCTCAEAKERERQKVIAQLNRTVILPMDAAGWDTRLRLTQAALLRDRVEHWKLVEAERLLGRQRHDPQAWFMSPPPASHPQGE